MMDPQQKPDQGREGKKVSFRPAQIHGYWRSVERMISAGLKSESVRERMTVSVRSGRILAERVPQLERRKRSARLAFRKLTSRNWVAISGERR